MTALEWHHRNKGETREQIPSGIEVPRDDPQYSVEYSRLWNERKRIRDGRPKIPHNRDKTVCKNGHPFDEENTIMRSGGGRTCRACGRERTAKYRAAKKDTA